MDGSLAVPCSGIWVAAWALQRLLPSAQDSQSERKIYAQKATVSAQKYTVHIARPDAGKSEDHTGRGGWRLMCFR